MTSTNFFRKFLLRKSMLLEATNGNTRVIAFELRAPIISAAGSAFLRPQEDLRRVGRGLLGV